ncbi:MAG: oligosaccharide flippase family protein [Deltaproteobacteria bacterium]
MPRFFGESLISQWTATLYTGGVSLGLTFVIARVLGPGKFGAYSYILTVASLFLILQDGGYKTLLFREKTLPSESLGSYQEKLLSWAMGHSILVSIIGIVFLCFLPARYRWGLVAAFTCFALQSGVNFASSELRGKGLFAREALWQGTVRTLSAGGILIAISLTTADPWIVFAGWAVGLLAALFISPVRWPRPLFGGYRINHIRRACLGFLAIDAATTVYFRSDIILLEYLTGDPSVVGQYAAAFRFLDGIIMFAAPLGLIWFRKLRLVHADYARFRSLMMQMSAVTLLAGILIIFIGTYLRSNIVFWTFGRGYQQAATLLPWLLAALVFLLPNGVLTQSAIAQNMERLYAFAAAGGAGLNIGLNLIFIPIYGALGAAWTTILTEILLTAILFTGLGRRLAVKQVRA